MLRRLSSVSVASTTAVAGSSLTLAGKGISKSTSAISHEEGCILSFAQAHCPSSSSGILRTPMRTCTTKATTDTTVESNKKSNESSTSPSSPDAPETPEEVCNKTKSASSSSSSATKASVGDGSSEHCESTSSSSSSCVEPAAHASQVPNEFGKIDSNAGPLKVNDDGDFEPMRWISQPYQDPALLPKVDEKGEYIVSKGDWPTGEMAYRPLPRTDVTPRFGYNIVSVKKPQTYWSYWRKNEHFNVTYVGIQGLFIIGMAWLMGFLYDEIRAYETEGRAAGNHAGEVRGKGRTDRKKQKIEFTPEEQDVMLQNAQESYLTGAESKFLGNRDYKMKKIARPEEYNYDDFRKR